MCERWLKNSKTLTENIETLMHTYCINVFSDEQYNLQWIKSINVCNYWFLIISFFLNLNWWPNDPNNRLYRIVTLNDWWWWNYCEQDWLLNYTLLYCYTILNSYHHLLIIRNVDLAGSNFIKSNFWFVDYFDYVNVIICPSPAQNQNLLRLWQCALQT